MNLHIIAREMKTDSTLLLNVFRHVVILCNVAWYPHLFPYLECLTTNHVEALGGFTTIGKNIIFFIIYYTVITTFFAIFMKGKENVLEKEGVMDMSTEANETA